MPILKLPDIGQRTVEIELCEAENKVYHWMIEMFIDRINGKLIYYILTIARY